MVHGARHGVDMAGQELNAVASALVDSATRHITWALEAYAGERDVAATYFQAGVALEHAAKAVLAELNPLLIAHPQDFETSYLLAVASDRFVAVAPRLRTINLSDALKRASRVVPDVSPLLEPLHRAVAQRNAVAHVGVASKDNLREDFGSVLRAVSAMLEHLGVDRARVWGEYSSTVARVLSEEVDERRARVQDRLDRARRAFVERFGDAPAKLDLGMGLHSMDWDDREAATPVACPACETQAVAFGELDVDVEVDFDRYGNAEGGYLVPWFVAHEFRCRACGLQLRASEFDVADLATRWVLEGYEVDPREYWGMDDEYF